MASQRAFKSGDKSPHSKTVRGETLKAIHATWRKVARGVDVSDREELRASRIAFANNVLKLNPPIESFSDKRVTSKRLGTVLDEMRRLERAPSLPGVERLHLAGGTQASLPALGAGRDAGEPQPGMAALQAEIHHLATAAQVEAIDKLFGYLGWSTDGREKFLEGKFKRKSHRMLTPAQANSCTMILFNIAASRDIRKRGFAQATRAMIGREIPGLKRMLGIDQRAADFTEEEEFNG